MTEQWHPERLDDDHLCSRYAWNRDREQFHHDQAERDLAELALRGYVLTEYPTGE